MTAETAVLSLAYWAPKLPFALAYKPKFIWHGN